MSPKKSQAGAAKKKASRPASKPSKKPARAKCSKKPTKAPAVEQPPPKPERKARESSSKLNARQEKFAQLYMVGRTATEAYELVYGKVQGAEVSASRLLSNAKVAERIEVLRKEAALAAVLTLQEKRAYLRRVVVTPLGDIDERSDLCQAAEYMVQGGIRGKLRRGNEESGNEEEEPETTTVKIKMADKLRAIEIDARLAGEFAPKKVELTGDEGLLDLLRAIREGK